jgi:aldose sugar dehydrogenase
VRTLLIGGAMVAVLVVGCSFGPAANRAGESATPSTPTATPTPQRPAPAPPPRPTAPTPAPARGSASVLATLPLHGIDGLNSPCCLAELPDGDLLLGDHDTGGVYRIDPHDQQVTHLGPVWEVTLDPEHVLLGLAVHADQPGWLYASYAYTDSSSLTIARYPYDEEAPAAHQLGTYPHALVRDIPMSSARPGGAIGFGPDGLLYAGTGDAGRRELAWDSASPAGKILRLTGTGDVPDDNPFPGSFVYSVGYADVRGLTWDAAGRLWAVDATASGVELNAVVPGESVIHVWDAAGNDAAGLAYGAGSLWLPVPDAGGTGGLWRIPLDGGAGLAAAPVLLHPAGVSGPRAVAATADGGDGDGDGDGLWVLTDDGRVLNALKLRIT